MVAPLWVARDTWPEEIGKWDHIRGMTYLLDAKRQIAVDLHYTLRWTLQRHNQALEAVQEILDREKGER